jgi:LemA protein
MKISKAAIVSGAIAALLLCIIASFPITFNGFNSGKAEVDKAWSGVEVQEQRRYDLIGNILGSVKGAQKNEQKFVEIAQARSGAAPKQDGDTSDKAAAATSNEATIVSIVPRLQEAYPELRSNEQVSKLISELQTTENGLSQARGAYNTVATSFNVKITNFPGSLYNGLFHFEKFNLYKANDKANEAPKVEF